jgi:hypothetical protein
MLQNALFQRRVHVEQLQDFAVQGIDIAGSAPLQNILLWVQSLTHSQVPRPARFPGIPTANWDDQPMVQLGIDGTAAAFCALGTDKKIVYSKAEWYTQ